MRFHYISAARNGTTLGTINFFSQVDLGQDKMVSGVVIQGGKHRDRNVFMKRFKVGHSLDGEDWTIIKDNTTKPKVGSTHTLLGV